MSPAAAARQRHPPAGLRIARRPAAKLAADDECAAYLATTAPVGRYLADQLIVPLALGAGGRFVTVAPSRHTQTQIDLLRAFTGCDVDLRDRGDGTWELRVPSA